MSPDAIVGPDEGHRILRFSIEDVQAFLSAFTSPALLAEQHGMKRSEVISRLRRGGRRPILPTVEAGIEFYRIRDIPDSIFA